MDKFIKLADRLKSRAANVSCWWWKTQLYENSGKLFSQTCNVVLSHECKSTVWDLVY